MRDRVWPTIARIREGAPAIEAHSRGGANAGGHNAYAVGGGARWVWPLTVVSLSTADALAFRAFLHSLRGSSGSFTLAMPGVRIPGAAIGLFGYDDDTPHTDGTVFDDQFSDYDAGVDAATSSAAAPAASASLTLSSVPARCAVGRFARINTALGWQTVRVTSVAGATVGFRPRLRSALAAGAAVEFGAVPTVWRLKNQAPPVPLRNSRATEVILELEEFY